MQDNITPFVGDLPRVTVLFHYTQYVWIHEHLLSVKQKHLAKRATKHESISILCNSRITIQLHG